MQAVLQALLRGHAAPVVSAKQRGHSREAGQAGCAGCDPEAALTPNAAQPRLSGRAGINMRPPHTHTHAARHSDKLIAQSD